jgi:hypothetical protein
MSIPRHSRLVKSSAHILANRLPLLSKFLFNYHGTPTILQAQLAGSNLVTLVEALMATNHPYHLIQIYFLSRIQEYEEIG